MIKNCFICNKEFKTEAYLIKKGYGKFCSRKCSHISQTKLVIKSCLHCKKSFGAHLFRHNEGRGNFCSIRCYWDKRLKGVDPSIKTTHQWVKRRLGKPSLCENCGKTEGTFDWSNKNHTYQRNLEDWRRLCRSCHRLYDIKHNNYYIAQSFIGGKS